MSRSLTSWGTARCHPFRIDLLLILAAPEKVSRNVSATSVSDLPKLTNFRILSVAQLIFGRMMSPTVIVFVRRDRVFRIKPSSARGVQSP